MRYLQTNRSTIKYIRDLPAEQFKHVWLKISELLQEPEPPDATSLSGYPYHRVSVEEYQIIYHYDDKTVYVILVGKRNDEKES
jgi:mRNA interferase RelE/StbE